MPIVIYFAVPFAASLALTPLARLVALRLGFVAKPKQDRWHTRPTALFGGVAILLAALAAGMTILSADVIRLMLCGAAIAAFGLLDDALSLKASTKLIAQITVACVLLFYGYRLHWTQSMAGDAMLTVFWIVGITNAFNLLDNMDGLCAGIALIAGSFLLVAYLAAPGAPPPPALYLAALLGATAGFLVYNVYPASIFMGDTGSLFLGLNIAALTLIANPTSREAIGLVPAVAAPVLPLLIPIVDTTLVTAMRILAGRRPSQGGRDHMSHRLVAVGLSEPRAVATLWILGIAGGLVSMLLHRPEYSLGVVATVGFLIAVIIFAVYLARVRVYEDRDLALLKAGTVTPLVANFLYKRRVAEVMLDVCLVPLAYYVAYRLRFEGEQFGPNYPFFLTSLPIVLATQLLTLFALGGYRGTWRHFGMIDAVVFAKSVALATLISQSIIVFLYRFESYSRSVFVIYAAVLMLLLAGTRASFRLVGEFIIRRRVVGQRCAIYGTTGASLAIVREAFGTDVSLKILGFIDDDAMRRGVRLSGYPVLGNTSDLVAMIDRDEVDCVVLNTTLADDTQAELEQACEANGVELLRLDVHLTRLPAAS